MSGYITEQQGIDKLKVAHDNLKACSFRFTCAKEDLSEYVLCLEELSSAWSKLCYSVKRDSKAAKLFYKFCSWQHEYNRILLAYGRNCEILSQYVPYFELMLGVTHVYIDTGRLDIFYKPSISYVKDVSNLKNHPPKMYEKWILVTSEMCGIKSKELPRYYPVSIPICVDSEKMRNYFMTRFHHLDSETERLNAFKLWKQETKPVLEWINQHLISKSYRDFEITSPLHCSAGE